MHLENCDHRVEGILELSLKSLSGVGSDTTPPAESPWRSRFTLNNPLCCRSITDLNPCQWLLLLLYLFRLHLVVVSDWEFFLVKKNESQRVVWVSLCYLTTIRSLFWVFFLVIFLLCFHSMNSYMYIFNSFICSLLRQNMKQIKTNLETPEIHLLKKPEKHMRVQRKKLIKILIFREWYVDDWSMWLILY